MVGYRKGSGICKHGSYKGYYCDSSWELAYIIYNLEHGILFSRNKIGFNYIFNNKIHKYYPDFIIGEKYVEIKGYFTDQVNEKIKQFPLNLEIIDKEKIKPYLEYTINKYGKDFIKLYD